MNVELSLLILVLQFFDKGYLQEQKPIIKFLLIIETGQDDVTHWMTDLVTNVENEIGSFFKFDYTLIKINSNDNSSFSNETLCSYFENGHSIILDATWSNVNWRNLASQADLAELPYFKFDLTIGPNLRLLDAYIQARNATDIAIIFDGMNTIHEALFYWIDKTLLRIIMLEGLDDVSSGRLQNIRPIPSYYVVFGKTSIVGTIFNTVQQQGLIKTPERWIFQFQDLENVKVKSLFRGLPVSLIGYDPLMCCHLQGMENCNVCPMKFSFRENFFKSFIKLVIGHLNNVLKESNMLKSFSCVASNNFPTEKLYTLVDSNPRGIFTKLDDIYSFQLKGQIETYHGNTVTKLAKYSDQNKLQIEPGMALKPIKNFFRIGITYALPWSYEEIDPRTKQTVWTGYCIDMAQKLSEKLNFDYELVVPKKGTFGQREPDGTWDGVVGDLMRGETDMAITALTMTADKEEVIDFVAPYFEQTGISIVMRKPVRKTSLFKFMTVLKLEVWLSIVGALVITGFMIWFLDKYSPYSARNNGKVYPYPCRKFTLKESFWFALTSFTPQGGGEAPKALSGRTLVAAYWLFVVLMLATFTANLAAFLTVERMQSPVQSLEQLAKQSRINYTVVMESETHQYFINMKYAEDTLYRLWKELTLNASTDENKYRVWDYPIKEQWGHILLAINDSIPVANASEGIQKVVNHLDADFAFIHDSSEIKYELSKNCNLTEVGEVFGERPYAVAVQQGSHLQDEISKQILELQKDRFFDNLKEKYWNHSAKGECPDANDSGGITLESLGGVFIATFFGLALAMITLIGEVIYYKRKGTKIKDEVQDKKKNIKNMFMAPEPKLVTFGSNFNPVNPKVSHISVYPRTPINNRSEYGGFLN